MAREGKCVDSISRKYNWKTLLKGIFYCVGIKEFPLHSNAESDEAWTMTLVLNQ